MKKLAVKLEDYINKYGANDGPIKYDVWKNRFKNRFTLSWFIKKYGEEEGKQKYNEKNKKSAGSLESFVNRYGEETGKQKYDEFRKKCIVKNEIKNDPNSKYNNRKFDRTLEYWINKCNGDIEQAKIKLKERQNTSSLEKFIQRHGEEEGKIKYIETNKNKAPTLQNYIKLYGEKEGKLQYNKWKDKMIGRYSLSWFIQKYGEKEGIIKREEWINKFKGKDSLSLAWFIRKYGNKDGKIKYKVFWKNRLEKIKNVSLISIIFFEKLLNKLKENNLNFLKIYFNDNEYLFYINNTEFSIIKPDFYIKDINLVIEFYGDYWHRNPNKYENTQEIQNIWNHDSNRIKILKQKYKCNVIIVWEKEFKENGELIINNIVNKIKKNYE